MQVLLLCAAHTDFDKEGILLGWLDKAVNDAEVLAINQYASFLIQQEENIDLIITSPLTRARQTGLIISKALNTKLIENELIKERNYGKLAGQKLSKIQEKIPGIESMVDVEMIENIEGAESLSGVNLKIKKFVHFLIQLRNGGRYQKIMVVSHNSVIRQLLKIIKDYNDSEVKELVLCSLSKFELEI